MKKIKILKDGPYEVSGNVPLRDYKIGANEEGESTHWVQGKTYETEETYHLCRCGQSKNKPFCDGSHEACRFHGEETADTAPYETAAVVYHGDGMELMDQEDLCAVARFCDRAGSVWNLIQEAENEEIAVQQACDCPSGRLTIVKNGQGIEPAFEPEIGVVEDEPAGRLGPLWVKGGIEIEGADGRIYEKRNRVTLCRCGASGNKPFCDAAHMGIVPDEPK